MTYTALPDRRMPYHRDGTVVAYSTLTALDSFALGVAGYLSGAERIELNDADLVTVGTLGGGARNNNRAVWFFFPELREVSAYSIGHVYDVAGGAVTIQGSNNSTNGMDGTWEDAALGGTGLYETSATDGWRSTIGTISFTGPKRVVRIKLATVGSVGGEGTWPLIHLYGEKAAGETPDDLIFVDHDTTPGAEYTAPEDFGDRPLGTTLVRQFRVKNTSATLTANAINLQCNDTDFAISTDGVTWVVTINLASLAAGAESATMYIRNSTPAPGAIIGPRFAEIVAVVGSWT